MRIIGFIVLFFVSFVCAASSGGPLGIDSVVEKDETGIFSRSTQVSLAVGAAVVTVAGAVTQGRNTRLGRTFWRSTDAMILSALTVEVMKYAFSRERPRDGGDPDAWFQGHGNKSFPSSEVAHITSIVTPFMLEYGGENPWVYSLAVLPVYDAIARVKSQAHWQTDVLGGMIVGGAIGYFFWVRPMSSSSLLFNVKPVEEGALLEFSKTF